MSPLLDATRVIEVGGRAAAVCTRLFAELGAGVQAIHASGARLDLDAEPGEATVLQKDKRHMTLDLASPDGRASFDRLAAQADLLIVDLPTTELGALGLTAARLTRLNQRLVVVAITPFGVTGPRRGYRGGDLVAFHSSGIARQLHGRVEDPEAEPPARAASRQAAFIAGLTAACAAINGLYQQQRSGAGQFIDVSAQEAMALMAARELAQPAFGGETSPRQGVVRGGSATGPRLPTKDGYVALSPREPAQWARWLRLLGDPEWGADPRFATNADRTKNYDALYELMAEWSAGRGRKEIAERCQAMHIPAFPFDTPRERLADPHLQHRGFFAPLARPGADPLLVPRPPLGLPDSDFAPPAPPVTAATDWQPRGAISPPAPRARTGGLPLAGVRVLDFSWVIAGPTGTRYLSLMGAEVIKVESPERPDRSRSGPLHDVVGQSKLGLSIDLKADGALAAVRQLLKAADVVVDSFATGVMERFGLGYEDLRAIRPDIIQVSSSGLGRTGPHADWVAYGSLLEAYVGFHERATPEQPPKSGMAWIDPLSGLFLGFAVVAALRERDRSGAGRHIDLSMVEGVLWTMPEALIAAQVPGARTHPAGNRCPNHAPHDIYRCAGDDQWLAIAVMDDAEWRALCAVVPELNGAADLTTAQRQEQRALIDEHLRTWACDRDAFETMDLLQEAGVPASATYSTSDLYADAHLRERGFYKSVREADGNVRALPGLPWRWGDDSRMTPRPAPAQGEHTQQVLLELVGLSGADLAALEGVGAFGRPRSVV